MSEPIQNLVQRITSDAAPSPGRAEVAALVEQAMHFTDDQWAELFDEMSALPAPKPGDANEPLRDALLLAFHHQVLQQELELDDPLLQATTGLYLYFGPETRARRHLLAALACGRSAECLRHFSRLLATDPPLESLDASAAMAPLFQRFDYAPGDLFPELLDALAHPQIAPAVLDLTNFLCRTKRTAAHPARDDAPRLIALLKGVCARLHQLEQDPGGSAAEFAKNQQRINDSVAIACSLCDALGLIGDELATTALHDALALRHRRIRVEAAAALTRLGDDDGATALAALAEFPISRLRAVTYAEELGLLDHVDDPWKTPTARAEAQLVCYLAEPNQLGAPPTETELFDQRSLVWPSFDDPQECFLFRFTYRLGEAEYTNIAIAGPLVHTFQVDLTLLSLDDLYALFAGWQAEHPDIHQIPAEQFNEAHQVIAQKIIRQLESEGFQIATLVGLGVFFGETAIIAAARQGEQIGALAASLDDAAWLPHDGVSPRPVGPDEAWCIWKGRRLLQAFN